jgi:nucleoside-diphosphate-sugar epimerase
VGRLFGEQDMGETVSNNVLVTAEVARACAEQGVPLTYTSTSEVYGDGTEHEWGELDLYQAHPHNAYGLTKRQGEEFCRLYAPGGLQVARLSMPYGPGLPPGRGRAALVTFLDQARKGEVLTVHKDSERSWCWVGDTVRGLRLIIEQSEAGAWNVGRDDNRVPMRRVAELACSLTGAPESLIHEVAAPQRQTVVKRLSTQKLRALGWAPQVELEEGMVRVLRWLEARAEAA